MTCYAIDLRCPGCGYGWHAATIDTASWWGKDIEPHVIAKQSYCVACGHKPPMQIVPYAAQADLLEAKA